jgi:preprotein translocase subunit SecG
MSPVVIILSIIYVLLCIGLIGVVLLQSGRNAGLSGSIGGAAETYWGKNKAKTLEGTFERFTKIGAFLFLILAMVLNVLM